jgi:hypothetical protein
MIVLDANILIRAVLGRRIRQLVDTYASRGFRFVTPDVAFVDAETYLPPLLKKRGKPDADVLQSLDYLKQIIEPINPDFYGEFESEARERLPGRDEDDWRRCWQPHWDLIATFGAKTKTFSEREWRSGRPAGSRSSSNHSRWKRKEKRSKPLLQLWSLEPELSGARPNTWLWG